MATIVLAGRGTGFRLTTNPTESDHRGTQPAKVVVVSRHGVKTVKVATKAA